MQSPETAIPKMIYPAMPREGTLERLKVAAHEAEQNVVRFAPKKLTEAQYYAGRRDGLLLAIQMLEQE